jgi:long-chain fatty acid transport protein
MLPVAVFYICLGASLFVGFLYFRDLGDISQMVLKVKRKNMVRFIRNEYRYLSVGLAAFALAAIMHFAFDAGPGVVFWLSAACSGMSGSSSFRTPISTGSMNRPRRRLLLRFGSNNVMKSALKLRTRAMVGAVAAALLISGNALTVSGARAGGLYLNEFATSSMGVAGAGQEAYAADASTSFAFNNPAGMTRLEGHHLSFGVGVLTGTTHFDADSDTPFSGGNGGNQAGVAPLVSGNGVYSVISDLKLGLSLFSAAGTVLDPDDGWAGRFQVQEIGLLTVTANPSVAYQVTDWFSVGAGFSVSYARLDYKLAAPPVNPPAGGRGQVDVDGDDWVFGFNVGTLFEISPQTRIGVTYVSETEPNFSGDLDVKTGGGPAFSVDSEVKFSLPQRVRIGAYHDLSEQWALLGSVGWEDWSSFDKFALSTDQGGQSIETKWKDTYHASVGVHYRPTPVWLLQTGIAFDSSPVSNGNRTAALPVDRQIRFAVGAQHALNEKLDIGGAFEYVDLGDAEIRSNSLRGDYDDNYLLAFSLYLNHKF